MDRFGIFINDKYSSELIEDSQLKLHKVLIYIKEIKNGRSFTQIHKEFMVTARFLPYKNLPR